MTGVEEYNGRKRCKMSHATPNFWWQVLKQTVREKDLYNVKVILKKLEQSLDEEKKEINECNP